MKSACMVCVAVSVLVSGCASRGTKPDVEVDADLVEALMPLAGDGVGLRGGDGAASCELPGEGGGRVMWLFGDSWVGRVESGRYAAGSVMVNNVVAVQARPRGGGKVEAARAYWGPTPRQGVMSAFVMPEGADGAAGKPARWCWPCDGAAVVGPRGAEKLVIFYADLGRVREEAKLDDVWNFRLVGNRVVMVENPREEPDKWRMVQSELRPRDEGRMKDGWPKVSWGVVAMRDPEVRKGEEPALLVFGVDGSNPWDKQVVLARVAESKVADFLAWGFWDGAGWAERESLAVSVACGGVDEFTIHKSAGKWVMVQGEPLLGHRILVRTAEKLTGPWTEGRAIYTVPEVERDAKLITYGAKAHPELSSAGELVISYCVNSTDFGQVVRDVEIYRPRFLTVAEGVINGR